MLETELPPKIYNIARFPLALRAIVVSTKELPSVYVQVNGLEILGFPRIL